MIIIWWKWTDKTLKDYCKKLSTRCGLLFLRSLILCVVFFKKSRLIIWWFQIILLSLSLRYLHAIASHVSYSFFVFYQTSASSFIGTCKAFLCIIQKNRLAMPPLWECITAFPLSPLTSTYYEQRTIIQCSRTHFQGVNAISSSSLGKDGSIRAFPCRQW